MTISNINQNLSALQGLSLNTDNSVNKDVSINLMMAALQLELSKANKENAATRIEMIREQQNQAAEIADLINNLRNIKGSRTDDGYRKYSDLGDFGKLENLSQAEINQLKLQNEQYLQEAKQKQSQAVVYNKANFMSDEMKSYLDKYSIGTNRVGDDNKHNKDEWADAIANMEAFATMLDSVSGLKQYGINLPDGNLNADKIDLMIQSLQTIQDQTGTDIQQQMVYVQDQIGQYNSYSQGASTAISKANEVLSTVVSAR